MKRFFFLVMIAGLIACNQSSEQEVAQGSWIKGSQAEQLELIEKHFRGFGKAMVEMDYRYQELYWAGQDQNWDYAEHQLEEMTSDFELALQRRPNRAESAEQFLTFAIPQMENSIESKDLETFNRAYQMLSMSCNSCHALENVPFFHVQIPTERRSSIRKP